MEGALQLVRQEEQEASNCTNSSELDIQTRRAACGNVRVKVVQKSHVYLDFSHYVITMILSAAKTSFPMSKELLMCIFHMD